jgi:hypothetical protein
VSGANMQSDISKVLDGMSTSQLYEIMVQMKVAALSLSPFCCRFSDLSF